MALVVCLGGDCACVPDVYPFLVLVDFKSLEGFDMAVHEACGHCASVCAVGLSDVGCGGRSSAECVEASDECGVCPEVCGWAVD